MISFPLEADESENGNDDGASRMSGSSWSLLIGSAQLLQRQRPPPLGNQELRLLSLRQGHRSTGGFSSKGPLVRVVWRSGSPKSRGRVSPANKSSLWRFF